MTTMNVLNSAGGTEAVQKPGAQVDGGLSIFKSLDVDETCDSTQQVKASAGQVYGGWVYNAAASILYLKFYNVVAASVTVGTTVPVITLPLPPASLVVLGGPGLAHGIEFTTAISVAVTTGLADNNAGAPATNDIVANIFYK